MNEKQIITRVSESIFNNYRARLMTINVDFYELSDAILIGVNFSIDLFHRHCNNVYSHVTIIVLARRTCNVHMHMHYNNIIILYRVPIHSHFR